MLKRDFTKTNKDYFKKNKNILIAVAAFLLIGIIIFAIFGLNGNFEVSGYNEFSIKVNETIADDFNKHQSKIGNIVNSFNGKFDCIIIEGEGDNTKYFVRYLDDVKGDDVLEINKLVAEELEVDVANVTDHIHVKGAVRASDYVYTAVSILLIILIASIFAYARYNGASAMAVIIGCTIGTIGFMSVSSILRLCVGFSYFAMLVILNMLIVYFAINLFETMHKSSWLVSEDYSQALSEGLNKSKFRMAILSIALLLIGLLFVLFAPSTIKYVSLNIMFMAVILLACGLYVIPFIWNVFITHCKKREYKAKATNK